MKKFIYIYTLVALSGCTSTVVKKIDVEFNAAQADKMLAPGGNSIKGSALIRQNNGGVITCAGKEVFLIPATDYARERITAVYGNSVQGYSSIKSAQIKFEKEDPLYKQKMKKTLCDAQGFFKFDSISDGEFYVATIITWRVNEYFSDGGGLMKNIVLKNNSNLEIVMAP